MEILQISAQITDIESGPFYQLLNSTYLKLKKLVEQEIELSQVEKATDETQTAVTAPTSTPAETAATTPTPTGD